MNKGSSSNDTFHCCFSRYFYAVGQLWAANREVLQLGRTLEWGKSTADFLTLSRLDLTCSTLGKSPKARCLTGAQIMPKFFHRWISKWIKDFRPDAPQPS